MAPPQTSTAARVKAFQKLNKDNSTNSKNAEDACNAELADKDKLNEKLNIENESLRDDNKLYERKWLELMKQEGVKVKDEDKTTKKEDISLKAQHETLTAENEALKTKNASLQQENDAQKTLLIGMYTNPTINEPIKEGTDTTVDGQGKKCKAGELDEDEDEDPK